MMIKYNIKGIFGHSGKSRK